MKSKLSVLLLLSFLVSLTDPGVWLLPSAAAADPNTATFTGNGGGYHKTPIVEGLQTQVVKASGKKVKSWSFTINGNPKGQLGSYNESTGKIELPPVNGKEVLLYGTRDSRMYYDIWRNSSGKQWTMAAEETGPYTFTADPSTYMNGVSQYPGEIPVRDSSGATIDARLRYSDGSAAAWSDALGAPEVFIRKDTEDPVSYAFIEPSSVTITGAVPLNGQTITATGKGKPGYGYVKVSLLLGSSNNMQGTHWDLLPGGSGNIQGRRYPLNSTTTWEAKTYSVEYTLTVTYEPIDTSKPDLVADSISAAGKIEVGKAATFTANFHNEGVDIAKSFTVNVKDVGTGTILKSEAVPSLKAGASRSLTFTSTFTSNAAKTFRLTVDSANTIDEASETNNTVDETFSPGEAPTPTPTPSKDFGGNFEVSPPSIDYGDSFTLHPKDPEFGPCKYLRHMYTFKRGSREGATGWFHSWSDTTIERKDYPSAISTGSHQVYMTLITDCGQKEIGPRPLEVKNPPNNRPPSGKAAFVRPSNPTVPLTSVIEGETMYLVVLHDPSIPSPFDPDGDEVTFDGFDFANGNSAWIKSLKGRYPEGSWGMYEIRMDTPGVHTVKGLLRDPFGATGEVSAFINVQSKGPIPIIKCPDEVIENHYIPDALFDSSKSYSPVFAAIDHSRDEWMGRQSSYVNGTQQNITVEVQLNVYDVEGRKSEKPASCTIIVKPDLPPIAKLDVPKLGIRNEPNVILNKSFSPDGDQIMSANYRFKYDALNNGFQDDAWQTIVGSKEKVSFTAPRVGKYLFWTEVTDDFNLKDNTDDEPIESYTLNIVNNAPEVSFDLKGKNPQPDLDASTTIRPEKMINWPVYVTNTTETVFDRSRLWSVDGGSLIGGDAKNFGDAQNNTYSFMRFGGEVDLITGTKPNNGFGANALSPWRALTNTAYFNDYLADENGRQIEAYSISYTQYNEIPKVRSNKKHVIFSIADYTNYQGTMKIYGLNSKKLSPLVQGDNPYDWKAKKWSKGSPYDYVINLGPFSRKMTWELSGPYLYVVLSSTDDVIIRRYDAANGTLLQETTVPSHMNRFTDKVNWNFKDWVIHATTSGNGVVLKMERDFSSGGKDNYQVGSAYAHFVSVSPNMTLTTLGSIQRQMNRPTPWDLADYPYRAAPEMYLDPEGNTYTLEGYGYKQNEYRDMTLFFDLTINKYDKNMNLIWSRYLSEPDQQMALNSNSIGMFAGMGGHYGYNPMWMNTFANELYVDVYFMGSEPYLPTRMTKVINMKSGATLQNLSNWNNATFNWDGSSQGTDFSTRTADGYITNSTPYDQGNCAADGQVYNASGSLVTSYRGCTFFREYVGDGSLFALQRIPNGNSNPTAMIWFSAGAPSTTPLVKQAFTNGQFVSDVSLSDAEMKYSQRMLDVDVDQEAMGFSFHMQDPRNRYAVETNGHSLDLVKYVNGNRTVLQAGSYPFESDVSYGFKVKTVGSKIEVFLNNIPILSATDGQFLEGKFGYFANKAYVRFSALTYKAVDSKVEWSADYAIWDEGTAKAEVQYDSIQFLDPENDPKAGSYRWSFQHTPRFLNNQGLSVLHGKTFESEQLAFDKVGDYLVQLRAQDDPHPDYRYPDNRFGEYRKESNPFVKKVTVHRRPVSQYTVTLSGDGKVIWTDSSYDPDRYESPSNYSTEATGIDYRLTRGILEKKFYYTTPSGDTFYEKLVTPQEKGMYEIGMAVKDEYGAWSAYTVKTLHVTVTGANNTPPVPGFNQSHVNTYRGVTITFDSTAWDKEDGGRENLPHTWYLRNRTTNGAETIASGSRTSWQKSFSTIGTFEIRQRVEDSLGAEAQITKTVTIHNQIPSAQITVPASSDPNQPTKLIEFRPLFLWSYWDADSDEQTRYQLRIYRYGGELLRDTDIRPGKDRSWRPTTDLPEKVNMYIQVRAYDGFDWSAWSAPKYFYLETNRPPVADFDWTPKPVYEGDPIQLLDRSSDPDGDALTAKWTVLDPSGRTSVHADPPLLERSLPGTYQVTLTVSDGKAEATAAKPIPVVPLGLSADVGHTADWKEIHDRLGHETAQHPKEFYAGEKLIVQGYPVPAPVLQVTASLTAGGGLDARSILKPVTADRHYAGELHHARWADLSDGLAKGDYTIRFEVVYRNGTRKTADVPIRIIGSALGAAGVHRKQ
ncbi:CARDB domain-containing protein [Paenibacillus pasadenensis]|nr:CARDB domain-containing protein [Paenibacillus pasadenensis]